MIKNLLLKNVLANTSWLAGEKMITMLANLLVALVLARTLNPEGYGSLNYLLAIIALAGPLTSLGLNAVITRELVNNPERNDTIIATAAIFRVGGAALGTIICGTFAITGWGLSGPTDQWALGLLAIANIFTAFNVIEFWFQAHVAAKIVARMRVTVVALLSIAKIIAALMSGSLLLIASLFAFEMLIVGIGFIAIYYRAQGKIQWLAIDFQYGIRLLKQGFWLIFSGLASVVYLKIDQVMLAQMVDREAVGVYAVASRLSEVWYFFATAITISMFPALLKLRQTNAAQYNKRLQQICDALFTSALILAISVGVLAAPIVQILFGQSYLGATPILIIHIWASLFIYMRALVSKWLIAENLLVFSLVSQGLGALINIAANWYLIPIYQGVGAAWATVISYAFASYLAFWLSSKTFPIAKIMTHSLLLPVTLGYRYWRKS